LGCNEKFKSNQQVRRVLARGSIFGEFYTREYLYLTAERIDDDDDDDDD